MELDLFVTAGLGDNSYVLTSGDEAAVVDPQRDVGRFVEAARARGATIRRVIETHVHNDYVSGALELREATGAEIVGPADAGYAFDVREVRDGDEIAVGALTLVALATPGHTPEHTAYLVHGPGGDEALFSGGSLIVGSAGRTDLLGPERTDELTRRQFVTMGRLRALGAGVALLPTHGAGSFCASTAPGGERTSTLGAELATNPALVERDLEAFVREQLAGLQAFPNYYAEMAPINRAGPRVTGDVPVPALRSVDAVAERVAAGSWLVDARDARAFAAAHVPGSLSVPLEDSFGAYVGWLVPFGSPLVLLVDGADELREAATQLYRIGWDTVEGALDGGIDAWVASGRPVRSYPAIGVDELVRELVRGEAGEIVDVRQRTEWDAGHLEGSHHRFVGELPEWLDAFGRDEPSTIVCASGYRSSMAASLLDRADVPVRLVAPAGVPRALRLLRAAGEGRPRKVAS